MSAVSEAIAKLSKTFTDQPEKARAKDAAPAQLRELVAWAEAHSPVGCTIRQAPSATTEVEVA